MTSLPEFIRQIVAELSWDEELMVGASKERLIQYDQRARQFIKELVITVADAPIPEEYNTEEVQAWISGSNNMRERVVNFLRGNNNTKEGEVKQQTWIDGAMPPGMSDRSIARVEKEAT